MAFLTPEQRQVCQVFSRLMCCNPFSAERVGLERQVLGSAAVGADRVWSLSAADQELERPNADRLAERADALVAVLRAQLGRDTGADRSDLALYEDVVLYALYERYRLKLYQTAAETLERGVSLKIGYWKRFKAEFDEYLRVDSVRLPNDYDAAHVFSCFFQIRRAFSNIFYFLVGSSAPAAHLRAAVWESIFTHDLRRYYAGLYLQMADFTTLVTGPSGTGKELVARAIGQSRYIPFQPTTEKFTEDFVGSFTAINLSALSPTLIESELFGHKRGAFTGASNDRVGWLEACPRLGTVFLDEIGELDPAIQVKLLRVLQDRKFQRLGDLQDRRFEGKIIAATNRDLSTQMRHGALRTDFYYRLCSDTIETPSLRVQLDDAPKDLRRLVQFIVGRIVQRDCDAVVEDVTAWVGEHLGDAYPWPGNVRELEQCVRNLIVRGHYQPQAAWEAQDTSLNDALQACRGSADDLLRQYCTVVYAQTGSFEAAAQRLKLDRRTVKSKIDPALLERSVRHRPGAG